VEKNIWFTLFALVLNYSRRPCGRIRGVYLCDNWPHRCLPPLASILFPYQLPPPSPLQSTYNYVKVRRKGWSMEPRHHKIKFKTLPRPFNAHMIVHVQNYAGDMKDKKVFISNAAIINPLMFCCFSLTPFFVWLPLGSCPGDLLACLQSLC